MIEGVKNTGFSKVENFEKIIALSLKVLEGLDMEMFSSPYSVMPVIQQLLGLNTPLMGSGDSPYSMMSISFHIAKKRKYFEKMFNFSLIEKRFVVDELYDCLAPILLGEEEKYIQLMADTRYKGLISGSVTRESFLENYRKKIDIAKRIVTKFAVGRGDFAHIVHYGYPDDLYREYGFLRDLSSDVRGLWSGAAFPVVNEIVLRGFPGEKSELKGWVIFIANSTDELINSGRLRREKLLQAAFLAKRLGARIIGMGGLVASFARGGSWLADKVMGVGFTTGHAYTIANIVGVVEAVVRKGCLSFGDLSISVVGAAGSIGSGVSKLLSHKKPSDMVLIDVNTFDAKSKLTSLQEDIVKSSGYEKISLSSSLEDMRSSDIIVVATNSTASIIKPEFLKEGAIIVDDSFPKNVSKDILSEREDVVLLEGGMTRLPLAAEILSARNMPDLLDLPLTRAMTVKEVYSCFAETLVLALSEHQGNYSLGVSDPILAVDIMDKAGRQGFSDAPLQCFDEAVQEERFVRFKAVRST